MGDWLARSVFAAYRVAGLALRPLVPLVLWLRARRGKEVRARRGERYGRAAIKRPAGRVIWVHAASVGETNAVMPLVARLSAAGFRVLFTSTTITSARVAAEKLPPTAIHQFGPLDIAPYVDRFLDHWRPEFVLLVESELWPTIITRLEENVVPLVVVNGRMSERSYRGWRRVMPIARHLFQRIGLVLAQSEEDGARFRTLGADKVRVTGNLKLDIPPLAADAAELERLQSAIAQRPVWVAASTHDGEEAVVAEAHRIAREKLPDLLTILVPRHPNRGAAVRQTLADRRLLVAQRSRGEPLLREIEVYLADTLGELGLFYRAAPVAFLGGSLVAKGGQNPIEAAQLSTAVLHGPNVFNFADIYAVLDRDASAPRVSDARTLADAVTTLLSTPRRADELAAAGERALARLTGALDATMLALRPYVDGKYYSP
ncbi:MAG TPA: 3-deoxy-D-manno-octulosonic acid transferase [Bauldia sp.]|nr:3-deoxy-D-manno-octulosonic acid transferase [Bauldia sp.]